MKRPGWADFGPPTPSSGRIHSLSGSSSAVERELPKLDVAGSIPVSRSNLRSDALRRLPTEARENRASEGGPLPERCELRLASHSTHEHVKNLMVSAGWLPDPDCTVMVPFASVTVNDTSNGTSLPAAVAPDPPHPCVNEKLGLVLVCVCVMVLPYR